MIVNKADTVIVMGTYNRGHLLQRSLRAYAKQGKIVLVVMDDGSTDSTEILCAHSPVPIHYIRLADKKPGEWRDSASFLNEGIKYALHNLQANYVFITHPEIIPGLETVSEGRKLATDDNTWVSCRGYYLTPADQMRLDWINWESDPLNVRQLPEFYGKGASAEFTGNRDYLPEGIESIPVWQSWIFGGGSRAFWLRFGGLTPFNVWGSVDVDLLHRRHTGGINTVTPQNPRATVIHQNHDDLGTPRNMEVALGSVPQYTSANCFKPELLA